MNYVRCLSTVVVAAAGYLYTAVPGISQDTSDFKMVPQPTQQIQIRPGYSQELILKRPYSRVEIVNPSVVDVQPHTDRDVTLVAGQAGSTIVKFRSEKGELIAQLVAVVWPPMSRKLLSTFEDVPGRVKIYPSADRTTFYRCSESGCELVAEQQITEASPEHPNILVPTQTSEPIVVPGESPEPDNSESKPKQ